MTSRLRHFASTAALSAAALTLLAGCWTSSTDSTSSQPSESASTAATPSASAAEATAPTLACAAGTADQASYECAGVTVTGAADEAPTVDLAADFSAVTDLAVADVYEGTGAEVQAGDTLTVNYVGVGADSREVFDSSWTYGQTATFGLDQVIEGWQQGMVGMKEGGRRLLIIPGNLGYGDAGAGDVIGPNETLVFVVDLVAVNPA